jgi:predicted lipid carrier protein YhbT
MAQAEFDPQNLSPEQFIQLVKTADDAQIVEAIHSAGTERSLEQIFTGMVQSYKGGNDDADIQWVVTDDGTEHRWVTAVHEGKAEARQGDAETPRVTLTTDLVSFVKMIAGVANGTSLFMSGKLKLSGDMMFAMKIESMFERPS